MAIMKLVNGLPTVVNAIDASTYLSTGLAASTPITLPGSATFDDATAADILIIVNDLPQEITRNFTAVGSAPYTQIQFSYTLPNDTVLRVKKFI